MGIQASIVKQPDGTLEVTHPNQDYLVRFIPPEHRGQALKLSPKWMPSKGKEDWTLFNMISHHQQANRIYAASVGIWLGQWLTVCFFLGLSLASMWAVDYPARTGRRRLARPLCYVELYLPTAALLLASLGLMGIWIAVPIYPTNRSFSMERFIGPWAALAALVALAHVGVIRRWRPLGRILLYAACVVLMVVAFSWGLSAA